MFRQLEAAKFFPQDMGTQIFVDFRDIDGRDAEVKRIIGNAKVEIADKGILIAK